MSNLLQEIKKISHYYLDLKTDQADHEEIIENIENGVVFKGTNLWILIFAIMVASVGLNVNATAVVIGAMLISPLMGPIMGIGLGLGIYDFDLVKKAFKNLGVAVLISVITSAVYFYATPLHDAQSELLARTTPTLWDVLIAFFGGLAGIVASTRKEKSNVIPGVAIATALMPPLCTAGFGLATGNLNYFLGAIYLFFINSVFISVSAFIIIRFLRFPYKTWVEEGKQKTMRNYVIMVTLLTMIPSIYLATGIVKRSIFNRNASLFIESQLNLEETRVVDKKIDPENKTIEVYLYGKAIEPVQLKYIENSLRDYHIADAKLVVHQNNETSSSWSIEQMRSGIIEDLYTKNADLLKSKDDKIALLEKSVRALNDQTFQAKQICQELQAQYPGIDKCALSQMVLHDKKGQSDTLAVVVIESRPNLKPSELNQMKNWLKVRIQKDDIKILQE